MSVSLLAMLADKPEVDVSAHLELVTTLMTVVIGLLMAFFLVRFELWRRMLFQRVDPRPAALMRISFGAVVFVTFADLLLPHGPLDHSVARFLFTDEGLWMTDMARKNYGGQLKTLWDPDQGFEHWYDAFRVLWGKFSILHFRSDPTFVFAIYGAMLTSITLMILGVWTRWTTILSWLLVEMVYRYSPVFYTGGDTVVRVFMFLGMFTQWGQAYSIDSWRRRRKAILGGAKVIPALRRIPAWPMRLMMVQLAIIYCATGMLKSGSTWANGEALYYALNLDHFYRWPQMGLVGMMQFLGVLPVLTITVHWWEMLFPLAVLGAIINAYEREREAGTWPAAAAWRRYLGYLLFLSTFAIGAYIAGLTVHYFATPATLAKAKMSKQTAMTLAHVVVGVGPWVLLGLYLLLRAKAPRVHRFIRHWILGKRLWLVIGFGMHVGIDIGMNVGTFANVMMAVYAAWLSGEEVDTAWRYLLSRPQAPGQGDRPLRNKKWKRVLLGPLDRLRFRAPGAPIVIHHNPDDDSVRRAALLRLWDLGGRLTFEADPEVASGRLALRYPGEDGLRHGSRAGYALIRVLPGLWWMRGLRHLPGLSGVFGAIAQKILRQR